MTRVCGSGAHTDGRAILGAAFVVVSRADNGKRILRLSARERGFENPPERCDEILRRQRIAIGPAGIGPQMERIGDAVRRNLPTLRDAGQQRDAVVGDIDEPFEQRPHVGIRISGHMRVETIGIGKRANVQRLRARAGFDHGVAAGARSEEERGGERADE